MTDLPFYDFMIDVETTGVEPNRNAMISLACVPFCWETGRISHDVFDMNLMMPPTRHWDEDTREWWQKQSPSVFARATCNARPPLFVMQEFLAFVRRTSGALHGPRMWAKPISFEFPLIASYFRDYELDNPFHFRDAIDLQSFIRGTRRAPGAAAFDKEVPFVGDAHAAIDDVYHQIAVALTAKAMFATGE